MLWRIRELKQARSPDAQYFRIILHGRFARVPEGFYTSADVVAASAEEALALYLELNPPDEGVALSLHEANALEPRSGDVTGVYAVHGTVHYTETP
jgi:hypothetical protein